MEFKNGNIFRELENLFYNSSQTSEDLQRLDMYKANVKRNFYQSNVTNLDDYLISLNLNIKYYLNQKNLIGRMAQLTQKTNQFNLTTKRYSENDINFFIKDKNHSLIAIEVNDKFGDNGIVGLAIIKQEKEIAEIDTFLMSCRVLGRKIEFKFMDIIIDFLKNKRIKYVFASYKETLKNKQVKDLYESFGYIKVKKEEKLSSYKLNLSKYKPSRKDFIKVTHQE